MPAIPDFSNVQTQDLAKCFHLKQTIHQRQKRQQPIDQLVDKLNHVIEKSNQKTERIKTSFPKINLQADLPITQQAEKITQLLHDNQIIIVAGETGCGKTTQLPKICLQAGFGARGIIAHTQPRRVAATSVAQRIADEVNCKLGELVGYSIRFNNKFNHNTRVKLITDGILLAELESDPMLSRYEVIIIDEAHERSLNIDFLLGFLKQILAKRKELKVIITSATIDPEKFSKSFNHAPIVTIEGRSYPVETRYRPLLVEESSYTDDPLLTGISDAVDECVSESTGDILIFADGEGQIKSITKHLNNQQTPQGKQNYLILPLYARLSINEQQKIFKSSSKRKIIIATNVAETSLTVPGILFVIDIGTARISRFSQRNKIQQLPIEKISQASANQRKGRCGRIAAGICIRLYDEEDFNNRPEYTAPEIKRTNLSSVVLKLKAMGVKNLPAFPFMDEPDERAWKVAFNTLFELGALDKQQVLTNIGVKMAKLPVDPQLACILVQPNLQAVDEMLIICSLMSVREVRERPHDKQQKADQLHKAYEQKDSDILTAISLWQQLNKTKQGLSSNGFKQWCVKNLINFLGWLEWRKVYFQLKESVEAIGIKVSQTSAHDDDVHRALIPGFITHIFCKTHEKHYQGVRGLKVWLHPSSLSFKKNKPWLLSAEMIETGKLYARMNAIIDPKWIESAAQHLLKNNYADVHWSKKKGQVMAYLNQTLLGLPIVNQRRVNYSTIDHDLSQQLFLKEGLAGDQIDETFSFLEKNRQRILILKEQEQRQRLNNICIDSSALSELYQAVLPAHVCSTQSLKKWLKKDPAHRNQLLTFSDQQLTQVQSTSSDDFPSHIQVKDFSLNLSYCFAPGTKEDGVSVEIPQNMLAQFNERDFDWLVPGYLEDKVLATIKTLPKPIRRDLIPLNKTAKSCVLELEKFNQATDLFVPSLAKTLQRLTGKLISENDFSIQNVEAYLTMKYKIINGKKITHTADLSQAKKSTNKEQHQATALSNGEQIKNWQFDSFEIERQKSNKQQVSRIFQGLSDQNSHVIIEEFPSYQSALMNHQQGVARLLILTNQSQINQFFNGWPDKKLLEKLSIRFDGFKKLYDTLMLSIAIELIENELSDNIYSNETFDRLNSIFVKKFRTNISDKLNNILPLIKQREQLFTQLSELKQQAFKESIEDMRLQLNTLWSQEYLLDSKQRLFEDYTRYHKGISARIKRILTSYPKEQQALETWLEWQEWWNELQDSLMPVEAVIEFKALFWAIQEFKISLFSHGVKVKGGISPTKLQKLFEKVEGLLLE